MVQSRSCQDRGSELGIHIKTRKAQLKRVPRDLTSFGQNQRVCKRKGSGLKGVDELVQVK